MARKDAPIPSDLMIKISAKAKELRDAELTKENLSDRLSETNKIIYTIQHEELPALVIETGLDRIGIPAEGNQPAYDLNLKPFYQAGIPVGWEAEKREEAFGYLEAKGAGDLIKTEITIAVPKEYRDKVAALNGAIVSALEALGIEADVSIKSNVHYATLTSWLKEVTEAGEDIDLEKIGGKVGQIVKPKQRKS